MAKLQRTCPLLVVDGDSLAHRAYHALPKSIVLGDGRSGGAIVGFANFILKLYQSEQPRAVLVGWDTLDAPTYRHKAFPDYQSGRHFDRELLEQLELLPRFVSACGFLTERRLVMRPTISWRRPSLERSSGAEWWLS
jgi:DNA polymerase-1